MFNEEKQAQGRAHKMPPVWNQQRRCEWKRLSVFSKREDRPNQRLPQTELIATCPGREGLRKKKKKKNFLAVFFQSFGELRGGFLLLFLLLFFFNII